jgi:TPR repeat protein
MMKGNIRMHTIHTKTIKQLIMTALCIGLVACGGSGGGSGSTSGRNVNETTRDLSNNACLEARDNTAEQPLENYVAALTELADAGKACAQYGLGTLYRTGYGAIDSNAEKAGHYLSLAAAQEHPAAKRLLGMD